MKCPNCRCEVGNQSVCPYCGATVYIDAGAWNRAEYSRQAAPYGNPASQRGNRTADSRELEEKLQKLSTKVNMVLILQGGLFALLILLLFAVALQ